jgi:hypothetical protein
VDHLIDKLTPDERGNRKVFHETSLTKLQEFCATWDVRVPGGVDNQLAALVSRAKELVRDVDPELLKSNDAAREYIRDGFAAIKDALDPMIVLKPKRAIHIQ